jgi:hypothetical protein
MASNDYHFVSQWRMKSTCQEISEVLGDAAGLVRWWPSVYLRVEVLKPGAADGLGREIDLYTKGWLPYTLRWQFRVTENRSPHGFTLEAWGDFIGRGIWTFEQDGDYVNIRYDWKISVGKPLLRRLSWLLKPVFSANHHWAMRMGAISLQLELDRRHARTPADRAAIAPPPAPVLW